MLGRNGDVGVLTNRVNLSWLPPRDQPLMCHSPHSIHFYPPISIHPLPSAHFQPPASTTRPFPSIHYDPPTSTRRPSHTSLDPLSPLCYKLAMSKNKQMVEKQIEKHLKALEEERTNFINTPTENEKHLCSLKKVVALFAETDETLAGLPPATRSRHKAARSLLALIREIFGDEVFFLCIFALPITSLGTVNSAGFVAALRAWWNNAEKPEALGEVAKNLSVRHAAALAKGAADSHLTETLRDTPGPRKRGWDGDVPVQNPRKRCAPDDAARVCGTSGQDGGASGGSDDESDEDELELPVEDGLRPRSCQENHADTAQ